jgi:hypothetical protein
VLGTHTELEGGVWAHYFVSHQLTAPFQMRALDVWPRLQAGSNWLTADWAAVIHCSASASDAATGNAIHTLATNTTAAAAAAAASGSVPANACSVNTFSTPASITAPLPSVIMPAIPKGGDPFNPSYLVAVPRCPDSGAALLGEYGKISTISAVRFQSISCGSGGGEAFDLIMEGLPSETIQLAWTSDDASTVFFSAYTFASSRRERSQVSCSLSIAGTLACT